MSCNLSILNSRNVLKEGVLYPTQLVHVWGQPAASLHVRVVSQTTHLTSCKYWLNNGPYVCLELAFLGHLVPGGPYLVAFYYIWEVSSAMIIFFLPSPLLLCPPHIVQLQNKCGTQLRWTDLCSQIKSLDRRHWNWKHWMWHWFWPGRTCPTARTSSTVSGLCVCLLLVVSDSTVASWGGFWTWARTPGNHLGVEGGCG